MRQLLVDTAVDPAHLERWARYDHPVAEGYGRALVHAGPNFEVMVVSWAPGDFSAIHDHGGAQWGAAQVFGQAEHATFRIDEGQLCTHARRRLGPGEVVGVSQDLVHQMGNPSRDRFLSLHIYGSVADTPLVTAGARVFDPHRQRIQRVDGGVFFLLPPAAIQREEPGPVGAAPTVLRDLGEQVHRLRRMQAAEGTHAEALAGALSRWSSPEIYRGLVAFARAICDDGGRTTNSRAWGVLDQELKAAARLQVEQDGGAPSPDDFGFATEIDDTAITLWAPGEAAGESGRHPPNLLIAEDGSWASLRTFKTVEKDSCVSEEIDVVNLHCRSGKLRVRHAGCHRRFLPPPQKR